MTNEPTLDNILFAYKNDGNDLVFYQDGDSFGIIDHGVVKGYSLQDLYFYNHDGSHAGRLLAEYINNAYGPEEDMGPTNPDIDLRDEEQLKVDQHVTYEDEQAEAAVIDAVEQPAPEFPDVTDPNDQSNAL